MWFFGQLKDGSFLTAFVNCATTVNDDFWQRYHTDPFFLVKKLLQLKKSKN